MASAPGRAVSYPDARYGVLLSPVPLRSLLRRARPRPSIRQWLLGASLLAVLGGYGALFATQSLLAVRERRGAHLQTLARLAEQLPAAAALAGAGSGPVLLLPPRCWCGWSGPVACPWRWRASRRSSRCRRTARYGV